MLEHKIYNFSRIGYSRLPLPRLGLVKMFQSKLKYTN